jgi:Myb/SANT-like DNA-binding domain
MPSLTTSQKEIFLSEINQRKSILFGKFDDNKNLKKKKVEAWEEIQKM